MRITDEQRTLERQQLRTDRSHRLPPLDENSCGSDLSVTDHLSDAQASTSASAPDETPERLQAPSEGCARAM